MTELLREPRLFIGGEWIAGGGEDCAVENRFSALELFQFARTLTGCVSGSLDAFVDVPRYFEHVQRGRLDLDAMVTGHGGLADVEQAMTEMAAGQGIRTLVTPAGA
jgi:S-(hydroxymethyl)glutathione dehydrogenase/alcohol dehydrogenase